MTVKRCGNCDHAVYQHEPEDLELCRRCACPGFLTPSKGRASPTVERLAEALHAEVCTEERPGPSHMDDPPDEIDHDRARRILARLSRLPSEEER